MAPKLLQKREVSRQKTLDRQREIDEGAKLATRVDKLRELNATEEKNLLDFRDKTMKQVLSKITAANEELESVEGAIAARKDELKRLLEPIETMQKSTIAEWLSVREAKRHNEEERQKLEERAEALKQLTLTLTTEKTLIDAKRDEVLFDLEEIKNRKKEAEEVLASTRNEAQRILVEAELRDEQSNRKEQEVLQRERQVDEEIEYVERETLKNSMERQALIDGFRELEKTKKELNG